MTIPRVRGARTAPTETVRTIAFVLLLVGASLAFSRAFACATPFAALAVVAAVYLGRRDALLACLLAWLVNQAVGFGLLHYPHEASTIAWGGAIGLAVAAAAMVAALVVRNEPKAIRRVAAALPAAFAAYEAVLLAATAALPSSLRAFAPAVVLRVFAINAVAALILLAIGRVAALSGVAPARSPAAGEGAAAT